MLASNALINRFSVMMQARRTRRDRITGRGRHRSPISRAARSTGMLGEIPRVRDLGSSSWSRARSVLALIRSAGPSRAPDSATACRPRSASRLRSAIPAGRPVAAVIGDVSFQYAPQALWTAAQLEVATCSWCRATARTRSSRASPRYEDTPGVPGLDLPGIDIALIARG